MKQHPFIPAKPSNWLIRTAQTYIRAKLAMSNKLIVDDSDLRILQELPDDCGVVLISNHADEADPLVCLELARRTNKQFYIMCNREAFDEYYGIAGWALQRLGYFSVKRGAHDSDAKVFAVDTVKAGQGMLLIFPEGEIFYLNEEAQRFHSGAIDISLQAMTDQRKTDPQWKAYIVPMVIKYHYGNPVDAELEKRVARMERQLAITSPPGSLAERLKFIQQSILAKDGKAHGVDLKKVAQQGMTAGITAIEQSILSEIEKKHPEDKVSPYGGNIDKAWQLAAEILDSTEQSTEKDAVEKRIDVQHDLALLREAEELESWRPHYYLDNPTPDRLAEVIMKLERQIFGIRRPKQLAHRTVFVKISEPIDMEQYFSDYANDPHAVRHRVTRTLHERIQKTLDLVIAQAMQLSDPGA